MNEPDRRMDLIEDALRSYPLAPVPEALRARVMRQIRPAASLPGFVFPWLEVAISLMCSTMLTAILSVLVSIPPATVTRLEESARIFLHQPASRSIFPVVATMAILSAICLLLALRLFFKPAIARITSPR
jgi:hypothetical protein